MVHIYKNSVDTPAILTIGDPADKSAELLRKIKIAYEAGERKFEFSTTIYGHKTVKEVLIRVQNSKCCFCESKVDHIAHGDIEHFRPKGALKLKESTLLEYPGYYWLAYDFSNLFFSCQICNQSYKKNYFPLADETKRVRSHHESTRLKEEEPMIIDPSKDEPAAHIFFNREVPIGIDDKGAATISRTGIDRDKLNGHRLKYLCLLDQIARFAKKGNIASLQLLREAASPSEQYSLMVRCNYSSLL